MTNNDDAITKLEKYKEERAKKLAAEIKNPDELIKPWGEENPDEFLDEAKKIRIAREMKLKK
jgi:hypothetical protein